MKTLNQYLYESILDSDEDIDNKKLSVQPKTPEELEDIIIKSLKEGETNLNFIDTSKITDMSGLFYEINSKVDVKDIDISEWDVSNVITMNYMFSFCNNFNSDLSKWNVSNVKRMDYIFKDCESFDSDLNEWDVSKAEDMRLMFKNTKLEKENKLPRWYKE